MKKLMLLLALAAYFTSGCTKAKPYKEIGKPDVTAAKTAIDTGSDYLYVASSLESARYAASARPHWQNDAKRVRFVFTEKALNVVEMESDPRFASNPTNAGPVLSIPVEYVDYRCAQDDFGKCTNKEEENHDIAWNKKGLFRLKSEELALQQVSGLPVEIEKYFGGCFEQVGSQLISAEITPQAVNIVLQKNFQAKLAEGCDLGQIENLSDLSFSVRYQHSFLRLKDVASHDYKPVVYTRKDEGNFGYFTTAKKTLDVDNSDTVDSEIQYFDRWNPARKVDYYLSEAFSKPENAPVKQAAYQAVQAINNGLEQSGSALRLELHDPVEGMSSGDIRHSMIVLEEDPLASGLIGYGPHAANPLTGEIVQAKVIMYLGTMKKYLKYNYDELVQERLNSQAAANAPVALKAPGGGDSAPAPSQPRSRASAAKSVRPAAIKAGDVIDRGLNLNKLRELATSPSVDQVFAKDLREKMKFMSRNCFYSAEEFNFEDAVNAGIDDVLNEVQLKPWLQLSEDEKSKVVNALLPYVFVPTLVHELGHNLGLRHNFAGSEDKDNFYSEQELKALGAKRAFKYSSVMDYPYKSTNELHLMGKYDIAALRYAYAEKVELKDGKIISLADLHKNPSQELKAYSYCTDEHVDANPNCSRFDEGTNMLEMAQFWIQSYEERYKKSNLRNGRRNFSLMNDSAQIGAIDNTMNKLRLLHERYEGIKNRFDLAADAPEWESIPFLKDLKQATLLAGQFYLNVLTTPDVMCAVAQKDKPNQIIAVIPIRQFSKTAITCFDQEKIQLNAKYTIVAEGGKSFNSRKDPSNDNPYADQIDVRGIWMDKLLAAHYLFTRQLGSTLFDQYTENFLDMPEMQEPILSTMAGLLTDEIQGPVTFHTQDGQEAVVTLKYNLYAVKDADNSHLLTGVLERGARAIFGLPTDNVDFHQLLLKTALTEQQKTNDPVLSQSLQLDVLKQLPRDGREDQYISAKIGKQLFFTLQDNALSSLLFKNYDAGQKLSQMNEEQLQKIIDATSDDGLTDEEKAARALGPDMLKKAQSGELQQPTFYAMLIQTLADLNR